MRWIHARASVPGQRVMFFVVGSSCVCDVVLPADGRTGDRDRDREEKEGDIIERDREQISSADALRGVGG